MILTITTTHTPATDLGFLLHKHPDRAQSFDLSVGTAHVFYPEATEDRCTAALLLEVDALELARGSGRTTTGDFTLGQYVNDRPYAASSLLASALKRVFSTAAAGTLKSNQALADSAIPLEIRIPALPCRGSSEFARGLFEPLGWAVDGARHPARPGVPRVGRLALPGPHAHRHASPRRRAQPALRAAASSRRRQALLGGRRRDRQAGAPRRGLAG